MFQNVNSVKKKPTTNHLQVMYKELHYRNRDTVASLYFF